MIEKPGAWTDERWHEFLRQNLQSRRDRLARLQENDAPKSLIEREKVLVRTAELDVKRFKAWR